MSAPLNAAVARLQHAADARIPCDPPRSLLGSTDIELAYRVQQELIATRVARGAHVVGRKIGLTSPAVQAQLGVDRPDFGMLLDDMALEPNGVVPEGVLIQPKVEAEIAFVLGADLGLGAVDRCHVRHAIAHAVVAIEIVDSRVKDWDIAITDTVADNASSGLYVLGTERVRLSEFEPKDVTMTLSRDGEIVSRGTGAACLGDPLRALAWLARTASEYGAPLRQGEVILTGALGPMVEARPGSTFRAEVSSLGSVEVTF